MRPVIIQRTSYDYQKKDKGRQKLKVQLNFSQNGIEAVKIKNLSPRPLKKR